MFAAFPEALRDVAAIVTIAPDQHPNAARLLREVRDRGLEKSIVAVGAIPHEELAAWYRHTDALFMPTLLESFSGTYLEAMAHERPILTSDLDFAHEVCGQAALYFDPRDPQQACREIIRLKDDPSVRAALLQAGGVRRQARTSSWDEIAVGVLDELRALARRPPVRP
jgi:glycosyltransferase involved in cell wall biosynthesis